MVRVQQWFLCVRHMWSHPRARLPCKPGCTRTGWSGCLAEGIHHGRWSKWAVCKTVTNRLCGLQLQRLWTFGCSYEGACIANESIVSPDFFCFLGEIIFYHSSFSYLLHLFLRAFNTIHFNHSLFILFLILFVVILRRFSLDQQLRFRTVLILKTSRCAQVV